MSALYQCSSFSFKYILVIVIAATNSDEVYFSVRFGKLQSHPKTP